MAGLGIMEVCSSNEMGAQAPGSPATGLRRWGGRCLAFWDGRPRTQNRPKQITISPGKDASRQPLLVTMGRPMRA